MYNNERSLVFSIPQNKIISQLNMSKKFLVRVARSLKTKLKFEKISKV